MAGIEIDLSDLLTGVREIDNRVKKVSRQAVRDVATEVLRLSQFEVPHDVGTLQTSGHVEDERDESIVGYGGNSAPYAVRLHEHPEYRFQKGRKGKFLEDPIKNNTGVLGKHFADTVKSAFI